MAEGGPNPPDLETQRNEITNLLKKPLKKDDTWYLVDDKWFKQWKKYVGVENWDTCSVGELSTHPGPIDNSPLFKDDNSGEIKDHLIDELDYNLVPQEAWDLLVSWYGLMPGQKPIARNVIEHGMFVKHHKVEVYLLEFKLCENSNLDYFVTRKFSKADTIGKIEKEMRAIFNIPDDKETRLWNKYSSNTFDCLTNKESTVQDAGLYAGQVLVIEQMNDDGTWARQVKSTNSVLGFSPASGSGVGESSRPYTTPSSVISTRSIGGGYSGSSYGYDYHSGNVANVQPGLCGLSNLGNTCFMNAALQCMSNTPPLTEYFINDKYWDELNTDNPLGMKGEIAKSYGELIKTMWSGRFSYTVPRNFKLAVGKFAPQFSGYQQQDCQELMAFLLDGLHEDLNRVKQKPYIELRDADGRPDEVVAKEAWDNYLKRNNSIIIDIFHGLLRSTLVCPECQKVSVTFDPFCYLSLPLPIKKERQIEICFVPNDPKRKPLQMKVTVPRMGTIQDLCNAVYKLTGVQPEKLVATEVYNHRFHKIFSRSDTCSDITDKDEIYVFEVPVPYPCDDSDVLVLPVYMKERRNKLNSNCSVGTTELFGYPLMITVPKKNLTADKLYEIILNRLSRYVTVPKTDEEWWNDYNDSERMNGEVEMTNGEDYDSDQQEDDKENGDEMVEDDKMGVHRLFAISTVNSNGNVEMERLKQDVRALKLNSKSYIAIEWDGKAKEKFFDLEEAVKVERHESLNTKLSQKKQVIQLGECLELFTTVEKLGVDDLWYCPVCKKHKQATKEFAMWDLPRILIIHLKRFSYNRYCRDKLDTLVEFPINGLNMAKYIINRHHGPAVYDLIAVANHYGGMGGGHYTAYAKNKDTQQWYYFDDSSVSSATEDSVVSKAAYVLFYMRRDPNLSNNNTHLRQHMASAMDTSLGLHSPNQDDDVVGSASSGEECSMDVN